MRKFDWNSRDHRLLCGLVARGDLNATEIYVRYNQRAFIERSSSALASHISNCRFEIDEFYDHLIGRMPTELKNLGLPAERLLMSEAIEVIPYPMPHYVDYEEVNQ